MCLGYYQSVDLFLKLFSDYDISKIKIFSKPPYHLKPLKIMSTLSNPTGCLIINKTKHVNLNHHFLKEELPALIRKNL